MPTLNSFRPRENEGYLSVNWVEYFQEPDFPAAIHRVREVFRDKGFRLVRRGLFAILEVGAAKMRVHEDSGRSLRIEYLPSRDDASHAAIYGYATRDYAVAAELAALAGPQDVYPAVS